MKRNSGGGLLNRGDETLQCRAIATLGEYSRVVAVDAKTHGDGIGRGLGNRARGDRIKVKFASKSKIRQSPASSTGLVWVGPSACWQCVMELP